MLLLIDHLASPNQLMRIKKEMPHRITYIAQILHTTRLHPRPSLFQFSIHLTQQVYFSIKYTSIIVPYRTFFVPSCNLFTARGIDKKLKLYVQKTQEALRYAYCV